MPDSSSILLFMGAALGLLLIPGPAVLFIMARSIEQGRMAGVVSVLGIATGSLVHVAGAVLGLSALLMSSALAFSVVKYAGAAYLIYMGIRTLMSKTEPQGDAKVEPKKLSRIYSEGFIVNVLNPKTALFFFAFLPQFVDPQQGSIVLQTLGFGMLFVCMSVCTDGTYALVSGSAGNWLKNNARFLTGQKYFAGTLYIALGLTTAFSGSHKKG
jgi:threonine/homoserine/homoserine lactone efflux protein